MGNRPSDDQLEIDRLVKAFFAAFTNKNGVEPSVRRIYELFIPEGVVVKAVGQPPEVYSVRGFVEPREQLLSSGALTEFEEVELAARTHIVGNIAQRYCVYQKTGVHGGQRFETKGAKVLQFVRTPDGWRLSAVAWDDEREGLVILDEVG